MTYNLVLLGVVLIILGRWVYITFSHTHRMRLALLGLEEALERSALWDNSTSHSGKSITTTLMTSPREPLSVSKASDGGSDSRSKVVRLVRASGSSNRS